MFYTDMRALVGDKTNELFKTQSNAEIDGRLIKPYDCEYINCSTTNIVEREYTNTTS